MDMPKKLISVDARAATEKVSAAGKRIARKVAKKVSNKAASQGSVVKEKLADGRRAAMAKLTSAGVKLTQKQLTTLKKVSSKYSGSDSDSDS